MIHLEDKYYIQANGYGWTLMIETGIGKDGSEVYKPLGYYMRLEAAIKAYIDRCVSRRISEGVFGLESAVKILKEEGEKFKALFDKVQAEAIDGAESV